MWLRTMVASDLRDGHGNYGMDVKYPGNAMTKKFGKSQYVTPNGTIVAFFWFHGFPYY